MPKPLDPNDLNHVDLESSTPLESDAPQPVGFGKGEIVKPHNRAKHRPRDTVPASPLDTLCGNSFQGNPGTV